jgi:hypothetical protein
LHTPVKCIYRSVTAPDNKIHTALFKSHRLINSRFDMEPVPQVGTGVVRDAVYDQINHLHKDLHLVATHNETNAPLYVCRDMLSETECKNIISSVSRDWKIHTETNTDGKRIPLPHTEEAILSPSNAVLKPLISKLKDIAPKWSTMGGCWKILKYSIGASKSLHTDCGVDVFAPDCVTINDSNRHQYMRQGSFFMYLNTLEDGDGGVTVFHNTDGTSKLMPVRGVGVLHPCISATQESSVDKFAGKYTSTVPSQDQYACRDTAWFHESTELLKSEKFIIVCLLFDETMCKLHESSPVPLPFCYGFRNGSPYLPILQNNAELIQPITAT